MEKPTLLSFRQRSIFVIIWGLLFAKCFTLEYMVQRHGVPVNTVTYVWILSISMALVATIVLINAKLKTSSIRLTLSRPILIWSICLIIGLCLSGWGIFFEPAAAPHILSALALIAAVGYGAHGFPEKRSSLVFSATGWLLGAFFLFYLGALINFQVFALLIILFSVIPVFWDVRQHSRTI